MPPDERLSMAEQLSAGWDKLAEEMPDAPTAPHANETPRVNDSDAGKDAPDAARDSGTAADQARDETGRFAREPREKLTLKPKEGKDAAPKQEREADATKQARSGGAGAENQASSGGLQPDAGTTKPNGDNGQGQAVPPPAHWNGGGKVAWEKLPYPVKQALTAEYAQVADLRPISSVIEPYRQRFQQEFGGTDRALGTILDAWKFARQSPVEFAKQFVQQFNIDPQTLGFASVGQQQQPGLAAEQQFVDPTVAGLQQRLAAIEDANRRDVEQRTTQQHNQIHADIQAFGSESDKASGTLAHPWFNDVRASMGALMGSGQAATLKDAYDMACWASPTIRAELQREAERKAADTRKQAVAKAQKAGGSVTGSPGVARAETHVKQSARADLLKNWDALEARV